MTDFLLLAFVFLIAGVVSVPIAARLGLGSVLGYLIAGIVLSPLLGWLSVDVVQIQQFAEFGVVMMLFLIGLELDPKSLWAMRMRLFGLGGAQVALTVLAVMGVAMLFDLPWTFALTAGFVLALSSTAIVLQTLNEKGLTRSDGGQASFAVLLAQDIAVIPMLALIPLLAAPDLVDAYVAATDAAVAEQAVTAPDAPNLSDGDGAETAGDSHGSMSLVDGLNGWQTALVNVAAIAAVVLGGIYGTRPIFRFIAMAGLRELFVATALLMVIAIALLMTLVGLSPAMGTFLAGVVLANSEYRHELESDIDPFRGLLLGLFFITVGAGIDFGLLGQTLGLTVALTVGLLAVKAAILFGMGWIFGLRGASLWLLAIAVPQAGEFGFVLLSFTVASDVLPAALADRLLLVIALSMLLTPVLFILYDRVIAPRFTGGQERPADAIEDPGEIIIAGRGRVGGLIDRILTAAGYRTTVIDYDSRQLENLRKFGFQVYYGDAMRPDLLAAAGIARAKLLVIAIDGQEKITELVEYVRQTYPHVHILARARNRHHVYDLWYAGCRDIVRETYDSSLRMGRSALEAMGIERAQAEAMVTAFDAADRRSMLEVAGLYRRDIPVTENEAYMEKVRETLGPRQEELSARMQAIRRGLAAGE